MKKLLLTCALLAAVATSYGQGRIAFANGSTTAITTNGASIGAGQGNISGAGNFFFGLYVGSAGTPTQSLVLNILGTNTAIAGRLTGGSPAPLTGAFSDGATVTYPLTFQLRGWSSAGGTLLSYEAAVQAAQSGTTGLYGGVSVPGSVSPTFSPTAAAAIFGTTGGGLVGGFELVPLVPEPSSIALGVLGLGAIALFRRRK